MIPIVTPAEMGAIDAAAPEPVAVLIERAGAAVARAVIDELGGTYGRRVVVVAGKGNNGADGRAAMRRLARRGVRGTVVDAAALPPELPACDLVVDAAYGTGFRGTFAPPPLPVDRAGRTVPVVAVDIPSGVDGTTGAMGGVPWAARRTVTFAALKPGLVLEPGASLAGAVEVADIGLDVSSARAGLVQDEDVAGWLPEPSPTTHKWKTAVWVIGGSPGLEGAADLTARGAMRAGAGYVRTSSPSGSVSARRPVEAVSTVLPATGWAEVVLAEAARFGAIVIGNGLGLDPGHAAEVAEIVAACPVPCVVDADALTLLGDRAAEVCGPTTVLTPHDGEAARIGGGNRPGPDRFAAVRDLAARTGAVVLLKGPCTLVAEPAGSVLASRAGDARLATLGSGDVLAGVIGALCAQGLAPFRAAAAGAVVHGRAGSLGWRRGLTASDLPGLVPAALSAILSPPA